jgi:hypothetical protein
MILHELVNLAQAALGGITQSGSTSRLGFAPREQTRQRAQIERYREAAPREG